MNKLYNLYEQVILETASMQQAMDAITKHHTVNIKYDNGKDDGTSNMKRYCEVYNLGTTKNLHQAVRVYQLSGPGKRGWKTFILEKISEWNATNFKFYSKISDRTGSDAEEFKPHDKTLSYNGSVTIAQFNKK
tara:strand:+ start:3523 stop:3921 length:399 start_codon:yes stop_codon:yes gene_type:complete